VLIEDAEEDLEALIEDADVGRIGEQESKEMQRRTDA
jgi:hypothetical protein